MVVPNALEADWLVSSGYEEGWWWVASLDFSLLSNNTGTRAPCYCPFFEKKKESSPQNILTLFVLTLYLVKLQVHQLAQRENSIVKIQDIFLFCYFLQESMMGSVVSALFVQ